MGFQSVYKRHTPFAIASYDYVIQGDKITIDKSGDVLLYMYLYSDSSINWYSIDSIDMIIGGQVITSWDVKYITKFMPFLSSTHSRSVYNDTYTFLPIPVPMLPMKKLKFHECEFKIHWKRKENVRCMIVYAFTDEVFPDTDILLQQVYKVQVSENTPIKLNGMIKCMISDTLDQPTFINYSGVDCNVPPLEVCKYNHTTFSDGENQFVYAAINLGMPRTCQRLGDTIFIFHSSQPIVYMYDTKSYFGIQGNYKPISIPFSGVWSSCADGTYVYACSLDGNLFKLDRYGNVILLNYTATHDVYAVYCYDDRLYLIGTNNITIYDNGSVTVKSLDGFYNGSFFALGHPVFGNVILLFGGNNSTSIWVEYIDAGASGSFVYTDNLIVADYGTVLFNTYDQLSASIFVDGVQYIASGYNNTFQVGTKVYQLQQQEQPYLSLIHDGRTYVYVYGASGVFRYETSRVTCFVPYCLDASSSESTGFLNFNMLGDVIFKGCGTGTLYTVSYNFLRIQNGMSGILYTH